MMNPAGLVFAAAAEEPAGGIQGVADWIDEAFGQISGFVSGLVFGTEITIPLGAPFPEGAVLWDGSLIVLWALLAGVGFTLYFTGIQFRGFTTALEVVRGKHSRKDDPGEVTHFQALTAALSGTVGLGNIAGVAAAVSLGGPGATFWMIVAGLFGMCTKFVECTLGVKYRTIDDKGEVDGGPFKYIPVAFRRLGAVPVAIVTGVFAISILIFGLIGGGMFQANQTYGAVRSAGETIDDFTNNGTSLESFFENPLTGLVFGLVFAALVALVIIGGIKSIARVTDKLVPAMAIVYVLGSLIVIGANIGNIGPAFQSIIAGAFQPEGIAGGIVGVIIIGVQRAAFSNEAGVGSAPIAHSTARTRRPVSEGFVASLEPFVDTVLICTMTALVIIFAGTDSFTQSIGEGVDNPVGLTLDAFDTFIPLFSLVLTLCVALFAFSTLITWSYYGIQAWRYLFGKTSAGDVLFRVLVCTLVVVGCVVSFSNIIDFADAALFLCIFINVIAMIILAPKVKAEMRQYLADRKAGRLLEDPEPLEIDEPEREYMKNNR